MPKGIPVATVAVNGGRNAGLLAIRVLALSDPALAAALSAHQAELAATAAAQDAEVSSARVPRLSAERTGRIPGRPAFGGAAGRYGHR
jgi:5-(carboxyamino)imidazole ribonucleotide mutase